jgi:hypothetical protein
VIKIIIAEEMSVADENLFYGCYISCHLGLEQLFADQLLYDE